MFSAGGREGLGRIPEGEALTSVLQTLSPGASGLAHPGAGSVPEVIPEVSCFPGRASTLQLPTLSASSPGRPEPGRMTRLFLGLGASLRVTSDPRSLSVYGGTWEREHIRVPCRAEALEHVL